MEIPAYFSKGGAAAVRRPGVSAEQTGAPVAEGFRDVAVSIAHADLVAEKAAGDAARLGELVSRRERMTESLASLDVSLEEDADHRTYFDRAKQGIEEISTEALKDIEDPDLKNAMTLHVSAEKERRLTEAKHKARALKVDFARGALADSVSGSVRRASETDDLNAFGLELGNIDASVAGAVRGGIIGAAEGAKALRDAHGLVYATKAAQLADVEPARFLSNLKEGLYAEKVDPLKLEELRRYADNKVQATDSAVAAAAVWEQFGPKTDQAPINQDLMVHALEVRFADDPEKARLAIASLKEKAYAHDKGVAERRDANLSAVWKRALAREPIATIIASPEFSKLDGETQIRTKEHLEDRSWALRVRAEEDPAKKAARHELYWRYSQPEALSGMSEARITSLYPSLGVELTDRLMAVKRGLDTPAKVAEAKIDADDFNHYARLAGFDPDEKKSRPVLGELKFKVENAIDAEQAARKRVLSREEKAKIMRRALVEVDVRVKGILGSTVTKKRAFEVKYPRNVVIPTAYRDKIEGDFKGMGIQYDETDVVDAYLRLKGQ